MNVYAYHDDIKHPSNSACVALLLASIGLVVKSVQ